MGIQPNIVGPCGLVKSKYMVLSTIIVVIISFPKLGFLSPTIFLVKHKESVENITCVCVCVCLACERDCWIGDDSCVCMFTSPTCWSGVAQNELCLPFVFGHTPRAVGVVGPSSSMQRRDPSEAERTRRRAHATQRAPVWTARDTFFLSFNI